MTSRLIVHTGGEKEFVYESPSSESRISNKEKEKIHLAYKNAAKREKEEIIKTKEMEKIKCNYHLCDYEGKLTTCRRCERRFCMRHKRSKMPGEKHGPEAAHPCPGLV
jgi:PHP family Zn ribbon phosphoesterase